MVCAQNIITIYLFRCICTRVWLNRARVVNENLHPNPTTIRSSSNQQAHVLSLEIRRNEIDTFLETLWDCSRHTYQTDLDYMQGLILRERPSHTIFISTNSLEKVIYCSN